MIYFGYLTSTHGLKGELKLYTDFSLQKQVLTKGFTLYIHESPFEIHSIRFHQNHYLVSFEGLEDINFVENLRHQKVYIQKEDLSLKEDEVLLEELPGFKVKEGKELLGKVIQIVYNKGGVLLKVKNDGIFYIPYRKEFILKIIAKDQTILVKQAKGLII